MKTGCCGIGLSLVMFLSSSCTQSGTVPGEIVVIRQEVAKVIHRRGCEPWEIMRAATTLRNEDVPWLLTEMVSETDFVRVNACIAASSIRTPAAAAAIFLTYMSQDKDNEQAAGIMLLALGRIGDHGRPFLVRILKESGNPEGFLVAGLAQSNGVQPRESRRVPADVIEFVGDVEAWLWWGEHGRKIYGALVNKDVTNQQGQSSRPSEQ